MRMGFGLIGLLIALAITAVVIKKQLGTTRVAVPPAMQGEALPEGGTSPMVRAQGQQVQQQIKQQLDGLMQQPRALSEESH